MTLKHDDAGFLIGDPLDLGRAVSLLESIRSDVRAMRQAINGTSSSVPRVTAKVDRAPATPMRSSGSVNQKTETAAAVNRQVAAMARASQPAANPSVRDGRGRFVGKGGPGGGESSPRPGASPSLYSDGLAKRIASAVTDGLSNSEDADPTVKAFKEVAEPMKRGYATLFGDRQEKQKTGWFRRVWGELKGIRTEQTTYEKATVKSLKAIEEKDGSPADSSGGFMASVLSFATKIGAVLSTVLGVFSTAMLALSPLLAMLKITQWAGDTAHDAERVEDIKRNIADPLKEGLKKVGIDKDADIDAIRAKNRREQNGTDEYERMDRARAAMAAAGVERASPEYNERLNRTYQELESQDAEAKKGRLSRAWGGLKSFGNKMKDRAFRTGAAYSQGDIDGLDDAHTRALVASTAETESSGGKLDITNKQGYMGRYQAGASWLADAGMLRGGSAAVKDAIKAGGHKSEWAWAQSGGMSKFLDNPDNWVNGMSKEKYLASAEIQDGAFKVNSDRAYAELVKRGAIQPGDSQERIAGLLKARHIAGIGGAIAVSKGGMGPSDANGTSARKYYEDLAKDTAGMTKVFSTGTNVPQVATGTMPSIPSMPAAPMIPDAPEIREPLSSGDTGRGITVTMPPKDHGQDLSDRRLAHIVTGGYSSA